MDEEREVAGRGKPPFLTNTNWESFRDAFLDWAMRYGEAGQMLVLGPDPSRDLRRPDYAMAEWIEDQAHPGTWIEGPNRKYQLNNTGFKMWEIDYANWLKLRENSGKLLSDLLSNVDKVIRDKVQALPNFNAAYRAYNVVAVWLMVEQAVRGRGDVSIYSLTARFFKLKQKTPEDWPKFSREWRSLANDITRLGNADQTLRVILNTHLILAVHQEQFKEPLTTIYSQDVWPNYDPLLVQLNTYAMNRERITEVTREEEGKLKAFAMECWICGSPEHLKWQCPEGGQNKRKDKANEDKKNDGDRKGEKKGPQKQDGKKKDGNYRPRAKGGKKNKPSNKTLRRKQMVKKTLAFISENLSDESEDRSDDYDEPDGDEDDDDGETVSVNMMKDFSVEKSGSDSENESGRSDSDMNVNCLAKTATVPAEERELVLSIGIDTRDLYEQRFILDTGCKRVSVCKYPEMLKNITEANTLVQGLFADACYKADGEGYLPAVGRCLLVRKSDANLISVRQLVKRLEGTFSGDEDVLNIRDKEGHVVLQGKQGLGGYWICTYRDLINAEKKFNLERVFPTGIKNYTAEERSRAFEAWNLCQQLSHPGFDTIKIDLDNNCYQGTHLTSQDVINAEALYGPCTACMEAKIKAPSEPTSLNPPATLPGEHLHCDLLELEETSIGGHTQMLIAVDEKTGYGTVIPMKNKTAKELCNAFEFLVAHYRQFGQKVKKVTADSENTLRKAEKHLKMLEVEGTHTPAGMHEKRVERFIQTLKNRVRALEARLPYVLPKKLKAEAYQRAVRDYNRSSNKSSRPYTPMQLVEHRRPTVTQFRFGATGLCHSRRQDSKDQRGEWCIFLAVGDADNSLRVYIPTREGIFSKRKFVEHPSFPAGWNLEPRIAPPQAHRQTLPRSPQEDETYILPDITDPLGMIPERANIPPIELDEADLPNDLANQPDLQSQKSEVVIPPPVQPMSVESPVIPTTPEEERHKQVETLVEPINKPPDEVKEAESDLSNSRKRKKKTLQDTKSAESTAEPLRPRRQAANNRGWIEGRYLVTDAIDAFPVDIESFFRVSLKAALRMKDKLPGIHIAIIEEIKNMMVNKVVKPVMYDKIPHKDKKGIIRAHMFLKFKYKANGDFDKVKARLVANGNEQSLETISDTFSPTVNPISVMTQLNITAWLELILSSYDYKGAFLKTPMEELKKILIILGPEETALWIAVYPELAKFVNKQGSLVFLLLKYMYGLCEAPNRFNHLADKSLKKIGFQPTLADPCLYVKHTKDGPMILSLHVDDILLSSPSIKHREWFEKEIQKDFEIVIQHDNISYLGMNITYDMPNRQIKVTQSGYLIDLVKKFLTEPNKKTPATPHTGNLFQPTTGNKINTREYLALVMSLMFIARFTRPDILLPVTVLATKSANPNEEDYSRGLRIVRYLSGTPDVGLCINGNVDKLVPVVYADASHATHPTGHGQAGIIMTLGSAPVYCKSFKIKSVTRSSSESELYALEEAATYSVWWRKLLTELKAIDANSKVKIFQDNLSTIILAQSGGNFKRTKHLLIRESFVRERIENNEIELKHRPTEDMCADFLTKPLSKPKLDIHLHSLNVE